MKLLTPDTLSVLRTLDIYPVSLEERYILYAPLSGEACFLHGEQCQFLADVLAQILEPDADNKLKAFVWRAKQAQIQCVFPAKRLRLEEFDALHLLPTAACNFSCAYCYAVAGRSSATLSLRQCEAALAFFINKQRYNGENLSVTYMGGGEPCLAWDSIEHCLGLSENLAARQDFMLTSHLVTNGSVLNPSMLKNLVRHNVKVRVSFEVIESVQRAQRAQFTTVSRNVRELCALNIPTTLKSIITPNNVDCMTDMVLTVCDTYPGVSIYECEPVSHAMFFTNFEDLRQFYTAFIQNFFAARTIAHRKGLTLTCSALRGVQGLFRRYCPGEFCVSPHGGISICHRIASPEDGGYDQCCYGQIDSQGTVYINTDKLQELLSHDLDSHGECHHCYARWHCGGGCLAARLTLEQAHMQALCEFTQEFCKAFLLDFVPQNQRNSV